MRGSGEEDATPILRAVNFASPFFVIIIGAPLSPAFRVASRITVRVFFIDPRYRGIVRIAESGSNLAALFPTDNACRRTFAANQDQISTAAAAARAYVCVCMSRSARAYLLDVVRRACAVGISMFQCPVSSKDYENLKL